MLRVPCVALFACCLVLVELSQAHCPKHCSGHGDCSSADLRCKCFKSITQQAVSFVGGDCSLRECPKGVAWADEATATDTAHAEGTLCSNKGICDFTTGICTCQVGYEGMACNRMSCNLDCNGHGICKSMAYLAATDHSQAFDGFGSEYRKETTKHTASMYGNYLYTQPWDHDKIYGCECDVGYTGYDCSLRYCPTGDDPLTTGQLDEIQEIQCSGTSPFVIYYKGQFTRSIAATATVSTIQSELERLTTLIESGAGGGGASVSFTQGTTACSAGADVTKISVQFPLNFGYIPLMTVDSANSHGSGQLNTMAVARLQRVTKEEVACAGRGICDFLTGVCTCSKDFQTSDGKSLKGQRGDCGNARGQITACPGETSCMGHGVCSDSPTYKCSCSQGYDGADCSLRLCPQDFSWFDRPTYSDHVAHEHMECSNMGNCDRSKGTCVCRLGFHGSACQYMSCPGSPSCSGHGTCLSMSQLAEHATLNGDETFFTYGERPNDNLRWDKSKMYGCFCDEGFLGYDCSLRQCPKGDDPMTRWADSVHEVQYFKCTVDSGTGNSFKFKFRQQATSALLETATAAQVKAALEELSTIGTVNVNFNLGTQLCSATGAAAWNVVSVEFMTELGGAPHVDLTTQKLVPSPPDMSIQEASAGLTIVHGGGAGFTHLEASVSKLYVHKQGTLEDHVCSDRGLCDYTTGICACFTGYGSSDGNKGEGKRGDCGYQEPFAQSTS